MGNKENGGRGNESQALKTKRTNLRRAESNTPGYSFARSSRKESLAMEDPLVQSPVNIENVSTWIPKPSSFQYISIQKG